MYLRRLLYVALLCSTAAYTGCPHAGGVIREFGYSEIKPPGTLLQPGTLISITNHEPLEARIICGAEASLGPHLKAMQSRTSNGSLRKLNRQTFSLDGTTLAGLKSQEHFQAVEDVTITLDNAHIIELSDDAVLAGLQDRSPACRQAVRQRVQGGYVVTMVSSALVGDMTMAVKWDHRHGNQSDMTHKTMVMQDLAVMFSGDVASTMGGVLNSKDLIFGVKDDEFLSALSADFIDSKDFDRNTRRIETGKVVTLGSEGRLAIEPAPKHGSVTEKRQ